MISNAVALRPLAIGIALASMFAAAGAWARQSARPARCAALTADNAGECVRLSEIQVFAATARSDPGRIT